MRIFWSVGLVAAALAAGGCGGGSFMPSMATGAGGGAYDAPAAQETADAVSYAGGEGMSATPVDAAPPSPAASPEALATVVRGGGGDGENMPASARPETAPLLVYTATIGMQVEEPEIAETIDRIVDGAVAAGGYLAGRSDRSVSVRVPSRAFREGLAAIEQMGRVTSRNVTADDVSAEYADLEVRLVNLRALRVRFEELLGRAGTIEEILRVQAELERIAREIDGMEGRIRYLRSRIAFSIVTVNVTPTPPPPAVVVAPPPPPPPAPPPRRALALPIEWLGALGLDGLIDLAD